MKRYILLLAGALIFNSPAQALVPTDSLGSVNDENGSLILSTGGGDRAISSLGNWLVDDTGYLTNYA